MTTLAVTNTPAIPTEPPRTRFNWRTFLSSPGLLFLLIVTQLPLVFTLYYSTLNWNLLRPDNIRGIGLTNYQRAIQDPDLLTILGNTLYLSLSTVVVTLTLGMILALLLNRNFFGRSIARTLLITPFLIMPTVSAVLWKNILFHPSFGLFTAISLTLGIAPTDFIGTYPMLSVIVVVVWQWTPFMMLILLAGLQSLPQELIEAGQIDGANALEIFRYIILPHQMRYIEIAVLLEVLFVLNIFGEIFVITSGGPGIATTNLSFHIYLEALSRWNIGRASAIGVYAVILANIVVVVFVRFLRREERERKAA